MTTAGRSLLAIRKYWLFLAVGGVLAIGAIALVLFRSEHVSPETAERTKASVLGKWTCPKNEIALDAPATAHIGEMEFKDDGTVWFSGVISPQQGNYTLAITTMGYTVTGEATVRLGEKGSARITAEGLDVSIPALAFAQWPKPMKLEAAFTKK